MWEKIDNHRICYWQYNSQNLYKQIYKANDKFYLYEYSWHEGLYVFDREFDTLEEAQKI